MMDNAIAASNGLNTSLYQFSKSYCITLNESGEVDNYVVVSGGLDDSSASGNNENNIGINELIHTHSNALEKINYHARTSEDESYIKDNPDYMQAMSILASSFQRRIIE